MNCEFDFIFGFDFDKSIEKIYKFPFQKFLSLLATVEYAVNVDDPKERVKYVQEKMKLLSSTSWIKMFNLIVDVSGTFPLQFFRFISSKQIFSSTYSTQPGPENCLQSFGATLLEVNYSYGCGPDSASTFFVLFS